MLVDIVLSGWAPFYGINLIAWRDARNLEATTGRLVLKSWLLH